MVTYIHLMVKAPGSNPRPYSNTPGLSTLLIAGCELRIRINSSRMISLLRNLRKNLKACFDMICVMPWNLNSGSKINYYFFYIDPESSTWRQIKRSLSSNIKKNWSINFEYFPSHFRNLIENKASYQQKPFKFLEWTNHNIFLVI